MTYRSLEQMVFETSAAVCPPQRLSVSEATAKHRFLNNPGSFVGPYDLNYSPYLIEPMDTMTSLDYTGMAFVGPARCGKSDMFMNWLLHTVLYDPTDTMVVHMTQTTGRDWSQGDLDKLFRHTEAVGRMLAPGRQNDNVHDKHFRSGMRLLVNWPTATHLSGKTIRKLWLMDYDRMKQDVDGQGSPFELARKRAETFGRYGMCIAEASPGFEIDNPKWLPSLPHEAPPTEGILSIYNGGDRRRWYWRCPQCRVPFEPDFSCLSYPNSSDKMEAAEAAVMACPTCGFPMAPSMKAELNHGGRWIRAGQTWNEDGSITGQPVRSDIASFWLKGPANTFTSWKKLVLKYLTALEDLAATGSEKRLKATVNTDQGLPYAPIGSKSDLMPEELKSQAKKYGRKVVPDGVRFLVATVDVQKNRFVCQVMGFGIGADITVIDRFELKKSNRKDEDGEREDIQPATYAEDWHVLIDEVLLRDYDLADGSGRKMSIKVVGCDMGGLKGVSPNAYAFWRHLRDDRDDMLHTRFQLLKGDPRRGGPLVQITYPTSERKDRHAGAQGHEPLLLINVNEAKDILRARLDRRDPGGGMITFADWLPDSFFVELTVEVRKPGGWENPKGLRNESWDLLCYAVALSFSKHIKIKTLDWNDPPAWAREWDDNVLVYGQGFNRPLETKKKWDWGALAEELA